MQKRTEAEWQQLVTEYQQSGLSQPPFVGKRNLLQRAKSLSRKVGASQAKVGFVQAKRLAPKRAAITPDTIRLVLGDMCLYLPLEKPQQTAQLIKALQ